MYIQKAYILITLHNIASTWEGPNTGVGSIAATPGANKYIYIYIWQLDFMNIIRDKYYILEERYVKEKYSFL